MYNLLFLYIRYISIFCIDILCIRCRFYNICYQNPYTCKLIRLVQNNYEFK